MNPYGGFDRIYSMGPDRIGGVFPLLAAGSGRFVYDAGSYVIKVAVNKDGEDQCRRETKVYYSEGEYMRWYLCPVIWYAPGMEVMVKAVPMVPLDMVIGDPEVNLLITGRGFNAYSDLKKLSKRYNLSYDDLLSVTSWGYLGNRPVLVDYGCKDGK